MEWIILLKLILAHLIGDFVVQASTWVEDKKAKTYMSPYLYLHSVLHAVLAYFIVGNWQLWYLPLLVFVFHALIDVWKSYQEKSTFYFLADQFLHLVSLFAISAILAKTSFLNFFDFFSDIKIIIILIAYILVLRPFAFLVDLFTATWRSEIRDIEKKDAVGSLTDAGKYIGMLERFLVLTFILSGNASAIGMLIAAKSILRFNDLKGESSRKMSEYVLIGTLLSFSLCIVTGLIVNSLLKMF